MPIKVLIVDDHPIVRMSLQVLIDATYDLRVTPPSGSGFGQETIQNITISGADRTYDVILLAAGGGISGTIRGLGGNPIANANVNVYSSSSGQYLASGSTDSNGQYSVGATGTVYMYFSGGGYPPSQYAPSNWQAYRYGITVGGSTTVDLNLPAATVSGTVTVSARQDDPETIRFAVRDTGKGIPAESFGRIFEKFGQLDSRKVGTGLGLAFCKLAVEAHGGRIMVESTLGEGSTFSFILPVGGR